MESRDKPQSQVPPSDQAMSEGDTIISAWNPTGDGQEQREQQQQQAQQQTQPRMSRRVCAACRRRKVGCDKKQPCQHCSKSGTECVYPPDNNPDAQQMLRDTRLLEQLHRLEPMFKTLVSCMEQGTLPPSVLNSVLPQSQPDPKNMPPTPPMPPHSVGSGGTGNQPGYRLVGNESHATQQTPSPLQQSHSPLQDTDSTSSLQLNPANTASASGEGSREASGSAWSPYGTLMGKLVRDDGRQRYVSGAFWEALHTEVGKLPHDMDEAVVSDDDDSECEESPPASGLESLQYAPIFNTCAQKIGPDSPHLPQHQRLKAWKLFKENVHPVATILHIPSVEQMVLEAIQDPRDLKPPLEALLFVIYFGAVNSLSSDDCKLQFGVQQSTLLAKLRRGADSALSRSRLMETDDMLTLQTFVVYLVLLRSRDPTYSWNMTGLAVRLAQSLGMHRDGSALNLSPFDAEMRRRLWWGICILDTPASEDYSCSPGLMELSSFDSRPPLNVNDEDLHPDMTEYPSESRSMTDMSFTAARCWASSIWRTMIDTRRIDPDTGKSFKPMTVAEKQAWVDKQREKIVDRFSGNKTSRESLRCLVSAFIGTIISNLHLMALNPLGSETSLNEDQRRRVFQDAIECMTHSYRLRADPMVAHWSWLTKCYNEWHAFAVILCELSRRPLVRDADKAWRVVEQSAVLRWDSPTRHRRVHQWRSVMRSIDKARRRRKKELGRRKSAMSARSSSTAPQNTSPAAQQPWPTVDNSQGGQIDLAHAYQGDDSDKMGPLLGEDMCTFPDDDGQLYFVCEY
ncbi:uncharacterized protein NECHADRAFT_80973 [Fusarium vanettenii 77-13-4]|uniref:Zn(2)-C6 fungal-type domain-containing protein n=1 Tax=Fusarium vanettenii (strain ATCC MYA-4622 / CBS 123669 / FGSC 9596 / NRRL 45880 / 77-13-4) TaxID=660122 RepID=C7ZGA0_FUSV7|nr:uncharacterized protein NECHADRAFT_80973 [Fusarium vanettenii 77-13-4]EEU36787.1 hypothetical protein NECHADRAFT_80973 [Fusarium vanettenii 77-13-4]